MRKLFFAIGFAVGAWAGWEAQSYATRDAIYWAQVRERNANVELQRVLRTPPTPHACAEATKAAVELSARYVSGEAK